MHNCNKYNRTHCIDDDDDSNNNNSALIRRIIECIYIYIYLFIFMYIDTRSIIQDKMIMNSFKLTSK
jgi:hypothetical protein